MPDDSFKPVLDRKTAPDDIQKYFSESLDLLREIINYGTNLIPRCYVSSKKGLLEYIVLFTFLRQVVAMLDGFEILCHQGALYPSQLQVRAILEAWVNINWILKEDSENRAKYYYVWNLRQKRFWALSVIKGEGEYKEFKKVDSYNILDLEEAKAIETIAKKQVSQIDSILNSNDFKDINNTFDKLRGKRNYDVAWYKISGISSVKAMADNIGKSEEYYVFYNMFSRVMHGSNLEQHATIREGKLIGEQIRKLDNIRTLLQMVIDLAIKTYTTVLSYYRNGEVPRFYEKFLQEWRERFHKIPEVKSNPEYHSLDL